MIKTKVTRKGQTVVPAPIRKQFGIGEHSRLMWSSDGNMIRVFPVAEDPILELRGFTKGKNLRSALIRERKKDEERG